VTTTLLRIDRLQAGYGQSLALHDVTFTLTEPSATTLLGLNGAGKSTTGKSIAGLHRSRGTIEFRGEDISRWSARRRVRAGLVYVPEGRRIFSNLSVRENLLAGAYQVRHTEVAAQLAFVHEWVSWFRERADVKASVLSGGEQQLLTIGRALMAKPRLLILDEPSLGLSAPVIEHVVSLLHHLVHSGMSILLLEQNVLFASRLADTGHVLRLGRITDTIGVDVMHDLDRLRATVVGMVEQYATESDATAPVVPEDHPVPLAWRNQE
jgi:branched-chain amino acid transport system ATP-binding protein